MSEKTAIEERSIFDKLEDLKNEVSIHLLEIDTMVALGREAAIAETEGSKLDMEWSMVFDIIGHVQKMAQEKINELDKILAEQRASNRSTLRTNTHKTEVNHVTH